MIRVLVFDFDGVILESVAVKDKAIYDMFEDASLEERQRVLDLHRQTPGINRRERITMLLTQVLGKESTPEEVDRLLDRFAKLVWDGLMNCPEVPGVRSFLEDNYKKIPCYVISAAPQDEVRAVAKTRDFSRYFVEIYGTPPSKAERLKEIMNREQVSADSLLFIGDKISDYKAAMDAGVRFLGRVSKDFQTVFPDGTKCIKDFVYCNLDDFYPFGTGQNLLYRGVSKELDEKCGGKLRPKGTAHSVCMRYSDHKNFRHNGKFLYGESENNAVRAHHLTSGMHNGCYVSTTRNKNLAEKFATNNFTCDGFIYVIDESKLDDYGVVAWEFSDPEYPEHQEVTLRAKDNGELPSEIIIEKYEVKIRGNWKNKSTSL